MTSIHFVVFDGPEQCPKDVRGDEHVVVAVGARHEPDRLSLKREASFDLFGEFAA